MAQESVSPLSFFSDYSSKTGDARSTALNDLSATGNKDEASFSNALHKANYSTRERPQEYRADKPKVNSHEPFFTRKPLPYHADESASMSASPAGLAGGSLAGAGSYDQVTPQSSRSLSGAASYAQQDDAPENGVIDSSNWRSMKSEDEMDDVDGAVQKSYDGAAVSYPMRRIAKDSLDEKTKEALQQQGLWNLPTMVMAQPTAKMQSMGRAFEGMKTKAVPVSKPIAQFMASLENELGVSPDRLVKAFQNLPPGALQASPEKTMALVVKNLGLNKEDSSKAMQLYSKMLAQMQMTEGKEKMQLAGLGGMGANELANAGKMSNALDSATAEGKLQAGAEMENAKASLEKGVHLKEADANKDKSPNNLGTLRPNGYEANAKAAQAAADKGVFSAKAEVVANAKAEPLNLNQAQNGNQNQNPFGDPNQNQSGAQKQQQGNPGQNGLFAPGAAATATKEQASVKDQFKTDLKHDAQADANSVTKQTDVTNMASLQQPADVKAPHNAASLAASGATGTAAAEMRENAHAKNEAIQSIINNAQMLAQKGGGEMHMTLKPDHLGEIQLRVALEGNHVNVQMTTERGEVKKLIEQGVHELRHGLAQHNLSMAKLDVSVGDKSAGDLKQGMPDFAQAREFAQQFHQQNGRREMLEDLSALRSFASRGRSNAMSSAAHTSSTAPRGTGRLNVVA